MGKKHKEAIKLEIRDELIGQFRTGKINEDNTLPTKWLYDDFLPTLSPKEEKALEEVISEMIAEGIIEYVGGPKPTYRLTQNAKVMLC